MEEALHNPALTISLALAAGMIANVVARHFQVPSIVLLLLTGVLLGPEVAGVLRPESLGRALFDLVGMAVAIVLFEGGLNLSIQRLRREATVLRRLITVGALVTGVAVTLAARTLMGWPWELAVPFGALLVVTGPTVVQPVLRRVRIRHNLATILEGEAVFIDAIGAILAVVALEFVLATGTSEAATGLLGLPGRFGVGLAFGVGGGLVVGWLIGSEKLIPEGMENILTLAFVLALFEMSEVILPETGILTAAVAGLVVGNMETGVDEELKEFKEQLTVLMLALLFVLLAATVRLEDVIGLGWGGVATVAAVMFLIRPLSVAVSTAGTELGLRDRAFLAWLAPRGVVAAAVASLFAQSLGEMGVAGGREFQALVFLVIAVTVVIQGGLAGPVASLLGVRHSRREGFALVGANPVGRTMAHALEQAGADVVLLDTSDTECRRARTEGLAVVHGSATDESCLLLADLPTKRGLVAVTPNSSLNLRSVEIARRLFGVEQSAVGLSRLHGGMEETQVHEAGAGILFGKPVDLDFWYGKFREGTVDISRWRFHGTPDERPPGPGGEAWRDPTQPDILPLVLVREDAVEPVTDRREFLPGDLVYFAWPYESGADAGPWLSTRGWEPVMDEPAEDEPATTA